MRGLLFFFGGLGLGIAAGMVIEKYLSEKVLIELAELVTTPAGLILQNMGYLKLNTDGSFDFTTDINQATIFDRQTASYFAKGYKETLPENQKIVLLTLKEAQLIQQYV